MHPFNDRYLTEKIAYLNTFLHVDVLRSEALSERLGEFIISYDALR